MSGFRSLLCLDSLDEVFTYDLGGKEVARGWEKHGEGALNLRLW